MYPASIIGGGQGGVLMQLGRTLRRHFKTSIKMNIEKQASYFQRGSGMTWNSLIKKSKSVCSGILGFDGRDIHRFAVKFLKSVSKYPWLSR
jgi:hypothetical protein